MKTCWLLLLSVFVLANAVHAVGEEPEHTRLFHSGEDGYPRYRIPSLVVTTKGSVLAICEGRKDGGGLQGNVDLILRRSGDNGTSWSSLQLIADADGDTLGNPCAVLDRDTGVVWLAFTRSPGRFTEAQITQRQSASSTRVFVTHSRDDGQTWASPRDITASCKDDAWTWYGTGPGVGVQLRNGRLLIPSYHCEGRTGEITRSHSIFSDDHGATWKRGDNAGTGNGESQALQRRDGTIYLSARTSGDGPLQRSIVTSPDGGESWSEKHFDASLFDPHCEASLLAIPSETADRPVWLYCHPAGPKRHNLTIRVSRDEGRTWPQSHLIRAGNSQYSSMALLPDGRIGLLYDCWEEDNYQLHFTRLPQQPFVVRR